MVEKEIERKREIERWGKRERKMSYIILLDSVYYFNELYGNIENEM